MFNFALFAKTFELAGESEEEVKKTIRELAEFVNYKFNNMFVLYINEKVNDQAFVEFSKMIEESDKTDEEAVEKYIQWAKSNLDVNIDEFIEKFEDEMEAFEVRLMNTIVGQLDEKQRKELIELLQNQIDYESKAVEELAEENLVNISEQSN